MAIMAGFTGLLLGESGCVTDVEGDAPLVGGAECVVASVHSDYVSTSVSLLRADGTLCVDRFLDSGSAGLDVVAALSGDVTLPSNADGAAGGSSLWIAILMQSSAS